jgi:ERCC4-type nuclease
MLGEQLPDEFNEDYSDTPVLIDTREQKPLHFNNSEFLKLDVGDYAVGGDLYDYTFVDRKSYQDFCATVTNGYNRFAKELERCRSLGCFLFIVVETAFDDMWGENHRGYKRFNLNYVFHRMREIQTEYTDCSQFVFSGSREKSEEIVPKILVLGKQLWEVDVQYFWNKQLKKDGLARRKTKTRKRVQGYKPVNSRKRGIFRGN